MAIRILRKTNDWLNCRIQVDLKKDHKELFGRRSFKENYVLVKDYLSDQNKHWVIILFVTFVFFLLPLIDIPTIAIMDVSYDSAKILADQRTANIATVISITLVVVGFLINNIAVKESFSLRLLFKHSLFYPKIYLALSTIACFFIISTFRETFGPKYFTKSVICGTCLAILIIILIGDLFTRIIYFTSQRKVSNLLMLELKSKAKLDQRKLLIEQYSKAKYLELVKKYESTKYTPDFSDFFTVSPIEVVDPTEESVKNKKLIIMDININELSQFLLERKSDTYYEEIYIGKMIDSKEAYIVGREKQFNDKEKKMLRNALIVKKVRLYNEEIEEEDIQEHLSQKLEEWAGNNDHKNIDNLLKAYMDVYKLYFKHR